MDLRIVERPVNLETLADYATVSIAFTVDSRLRVDLVDGGLGGIRLTEEPVDLPWTKDYDADESEGPTRWATRWDTRNWAIIAAFDDADRIGGVVLAWKTPGSWFLRGQDDVAAVWDIRVAPRYRGRGVGRALFARAAEWARARDCRRLMVETQQINVGACRFYAAQGCTLSLLDRHAYPDHPHEVELVWCLEL